jgi:internalin A
MAGTLRSRHRYDLWGLMDLVGIPQEFRDRLSDDGRRLSLARMELTEVPGWVGPPPACTGAAECSSGTPSPPTPPRHCWNCVATASWSSRSAPPDLYFNVLRDSIEDLITRRWPGLDYRLFIPCPGGNGTRCPGQFRLDGLLRIREAGQTTVIPCMDCGQLHEISALLTGFTAPAQPLLAELNAMRGQLASIGSGITNIQAQAAQISDIADVVRRVHRVVSTEVADCPRLFTFAPVRPAAVIKRVRVDQDHYRLTLWCEHSGYEHPWEPAAYGLDPPKEWLTEIAPYAVLVFRALQLIVPAAGAVAIAAMPQAQQPVAQAYLQAMGTILDDLPSKAERPVPGSAFITPSGQPTATDPGQLTAAEGEGLRALRAIVFDHDPLRAFGGLRRVQAPSGDLLWVCAKHYPEYDPGLPVIH